MKVKNKRDLNRRKFDGDWDQVLYCYHKILHWFYSPRPNRSRASRFCRTLEPILKRVANKREAIKGEECWSLLYEVRGDLNKAILYRRNEIELIRRLRKIDPRTEDYGPDDLADRLILLGILYKESNDIRQAVTAVREARRICASNCVKFGSSDLLREYEAEMRGSGRAPRTDAQPKRKARIASGTRRKDSDWHTESI